MEILDNAAMREADRITIEERGVPSLTLMERAGQAVATQARAMMRAPGSIVVVCGKGGNGGDGLVAARVLFEAGLQVSALVLAPAPSLSADARQSLDRARAAGVPVRELSPGSADALSEALAGADLIVDALFGTGLERAVAAPWDLAIKSINDAGRPVLSIDLPSGLSGSTGEIPGEAVKATLTLALQTLKWPHALYPAHTLCGHVHVADIGIGREALSRVSLHARLVTSRDASAAFPGRPLDSHKGTFGRLLIVAGSRDMPGAAQLSVHGALMGGAGLITVASVPATAALVATRFPDVLWRRLPAAEDGAMAAHAATEVLEAARGASAVLLGPGLSRSPHTREACLRLVKEIEAPLVVDADGCNAIADAGALLLLAGRKAPTVLTPHPGEARRLLPAIGADRVAAARLLARESSAVVVLKGHRSIVAEPDGSVRICLAGSPALARGGSGDVLAGFLASILARGVAPAPAAAAAVYLHGLAGEILARERGEHMVSASMLPDALPVALRLARERALDRPPDDDSDRPVTEL